MTQQQLHRLLEKYLEGSASKAEEALLLDYYYGCQQGEWNEAELGDPSEMEQVLWQRLQQRIRQPRVVPLYRKYWFRTTAAASIVLLAVLAMWHYAANEPLTEQRPANIPSFTQPAHLQAALYLSNGAVLVLADTARGILVRDGGYAVRKMGRKIIYEKAVGEPAHAGVAYHMLSLPPGSQYQVVLPDGSRVWLNATTRMRFPLRFAPDKRLVEMQGEAYFEVARDTKRVFQVQPVGADGKARDSRVEVLGTHFNVEAYRDEQAIRTTLLEGKVKLAFTADSRRATVLAPGQQAVASGAKAVAVARVDVNRVVAWQQGLFNFEGADTREVMQQLARWYGLELSYGRLNEGLRFSGKISRSTSLADVLRILAQSGLRCSLQGKSLHVGA